MELINAYGESVNTELKTKSTKNPWDQAHDYLDTSSSNDYVEPNIESTLFEPQITSLKLKSAEIGYLERWPQPNEETNNLTWYFNDNFSQLRKAKSEVLKKVGKENCKIKIAVIDTGYHENHPALPCGFGKPQGISFIKGEENQYAIDKDAGKKIEHNGHGTATMCILAGKEVDINVSGQTYKGDFGAIPFAEVIPIRISESVVLIRGKEFVKAVEYAINQGCEVISMSMAGAPTKAWAKVVNKAYENGIVLVTAAGNSWYEGIATLLPKRVLYPARWDRVIAATGVCYNHKPYVMNAQIRFKGINSENMQGNYGPKSAMNSALAAYTPNTTWATLNDPKNPFSLNGGGTSSATPQIAAAAALWIVNYRKEINDLMKKHPADKWRKVEMVKNALFTSADTSFAKSEKYFGKGTLKASNALSIPPSLQNLKKAKKATVSLWGILDLLGVFLRVKSGNNEEMFTRSEMFSVEILQELHINSNLHKFLDYEENHIWSTKEKEEIKKELLASKNTSNRLKGFLNE